MAATIDFGGTDSTLGVYGLYNDFYVILETTTVTYFKHKFRISASIDGVADTEVVKDVDSIDGRIIINPVEVMKDWFKSFEGDANYDILGGNRLRAYNTIRIQVGEVYADLVDDPATFRGYDTDNDFNFFNGYLEIQSGDYPAFEYSQFNLEWFDLDNFLVKLPIVKKEFSIDFTFSALATLGDIYVYSFLNGLVIESPTLGTNLLYKAKTIEVHFYDVDGNFLQQEDEVLGVIPDVGVGGVNLRTAIDFEAVTWDYVEVKTLYEETGGESFYTETLTIRQSKENEKYDRFRLRWFNRYAGFEYENFILQSTRDLQVEGGKKILRSSVNQAAATLQDIKYPSQPEVIQVGRSAERVYRLNSDWMSQEQLDALEEMYISPNVIMFDVNNNIIPVTVLGSTYQISEVKDGLQKVSVELQVANRVKIVKQ